MPLWVAFDLDATIGCFESVHNYITLFAPWLLQEIYQAPYWRGPAQPVVAVDEKMKPALFLAFRAFVAKMASFEKENRLLRPGIIPIIERLLAAKKAGRVGGLMIYSNNSSRHMLIFAHELLKAVMGLKEDIFCPLVDWWHGVRDDECRKVADASLGYGLKTVNTIQRSFIMAALQERCGYGVLDRKKVSAENIVFFDDLIHPEIYGHIPRAQYFHVQPYKRYIGSGHLMHQAFYEAYEEFGLNRSAALIGQFWKLGFDLRTKQAGFTTIKRTQPSGAETAVDDGPELLRRVNALLGPAGGKRQTRKHSRN